jgi:hypothetical protein
MLTRLETVTRVSLVAPRGRVRMRVGCSRGRTGRIGMNLAAAAAETVYVRPRMSRPPRPLDRGLQCRDGNGQGGARALGTHRLGLRRPKRPAPKPKFPTRAARSAWRNSTRETSVSAPKWH